MELLEREDISLSELKAIIHSKDIKPAIKTYHHYNGKKVKFGVISDTHIGHKKFDEIMLDHARYEFQKEGIKDIYHPGDICEGMSGRPGHVYELAHIGFQQQTDEAVRVFEKYLNKFQIYAITGNHDDWFKLKNDNGANVGRSLADRLDNFTYLGENEADVMLAHNVKLKLFHPNDGTAYATSYKLQKLIESLGGGEKPNILLSGHYHKAMYMFCRNVHGFESGTLCGQSWFMRGKKIPAHKGFWAVQAELGTRGVESLKTIFYPAYD